MREESSREDMEAARDVRVAARRLERQERYLTLLRAAERVRVDNELDLALTEVIKTGDDELGVFRQQAGGKIVGRRRPTGATEKLRSPTVSVFLDECGAHSLNAKEDFGAFCLAAAIVSDDQLKRLDADWRAWKQTELGSADRLIHEPDVRRGQKSFFFKGSKSQRALARLSLKKQITKLDFMGVVCVLHRDEYKQLYGLDAMDASLPAHVYLMMLNFIAERIVMVIDKHFGSGRARVIAESRGYLEDALVQYEFARLQLDGTSYVSASWFRHQLCSGIEFKGKKQNSTGLQLADLMARPCGEKVLDPTATPDRWPEFRDKLCQDKETAHSPLGLKIVPWDEKYAGLWIS